MARLIGRSHKHILVVDDDPALRETLELLLGKLGHRVTTCAGGEEALEALDAMIPDLVILDVNMPGIDGIELSRHITSRRDLSLVPIIFLSASATINDKILGLKQNVTDYITKPFNTAEFLARVANVLRMGDCYRRMLTVDELTGLHNYNFFAREFPLRFQAAQRYGRSLSLVMIDIDHFKRINDDYGHLCGNAMLRAVAKLLKGSLRRSDVVVRCGGDEFALLLPETGAAAARLLVSRLKQEIGKVGVLCAGKRMGVSASFGVASCTPRIHTSEELFALADERMYADKRARASAESKRRTRLR